MAVPARRDDTVEVLHGVEVADPYRWMEDLTDPDLARWVDEVADEARATLDDLPGRDALRTSLRTALDQPRGGAPWRRGAWWYQLRNAGLQDHDVLWCARDVAGDGTAPHDDWQVLLDPNQWEGARSLGPVAASDTGLLAYAVSEAGSDWQTWHVRDVASGEDLDDEVRWSKFSGAAWLPDGTALVTTTFPAPEPGREHEAQTRGQQVVVHHLDGATEVVHDLPNEPDAGFSPEVSHDGRWVVVTVSRGTDPETRLHVLPIAEDGSLDAVVRLVDEAAAAWHPIGVVDTPTHGAELWAVTDDDAPLRRVVALALDGSGTRREVLGEDTGLLEAAAIAGAAGADAPGWLVTSHLRDAASEVAVHDLDGVRLRTLDLGLVSAGDPHLGGQLRADRRSSRVHVGATSFTTPRLVARHDCRSGGTTHLTHDLRRRAATGATGPGDLGAGDEMVVDRVFVASGDVRVPVFLLRRPDVEPTGTVPTILWGYGGFNIAVTPHHRPAWRAWVAHGGVMAIACLRGGSEYGRTWADAGRREHKQQVFDDALAVAGWLCGEDDAFDGRGDEAAPLEGPAWTSSGHLGIEGRSNGGLLAAACLTQAPDRFGSAVPEVGVLDLLRFHRFTIGWAWTSDYGDPDVEADFHVARSYSPLHNLREGEHYPPTLLTTADTDDRVVPSHSFKFAAALRHAQGGDAPVVLRVDRAAGHGAGKPTSQVIEERVDVLAWHAHHLGLDL